MREPGGWMRKLDHVSLVVAILHMCFAALAFGQGRLQTALVMLGCAALWLVTWQVPRIGAWMRRRFERGPTRF